MALPNLEAILFCVVSDFFDESPESVLIVKEAIEHAKDEG